MGTQKRKVYISGPQQQAQSADKNPRFLESSRPLERSSHISHLHDQQACAGIVSTQPECLCLDPVEQTHIWILKRSKNEKLGDTNPYDLTEAFMLLTPAQRELYFAPELLGVSAKSQPAGRVCRTTFSTAVQLPHSNSKSKVPGNKILRDSLRSVGARPSAGVLASGPAGDVDMWSIEL